MSQIIFTFVVLMIFGIAGALLWEHTVRSAMARDRIKYAARPRRTLSERQIRNALRVDDGEPLWVAFHQLLGDMIADAHEEATDADNQLKPPLPSYYAGAAKHLERFRDFLLTERAKALEEELSAD